MGRSGRIALGLAGYTPGNIRLFSITITGNTNWKSLRATNITTRSSKLRDTYGKIATIRIGNCCTGDAAFILKPSSHGAGANLKVINEVMGMYVSLNMLVHE